MFNFILGNSETGEFIARLIPYVLGGYIVFFIHLYIFRAVFNIPSFLRYQKAQIKLLEELAKAQGVDGAKVQGIISETHGWNDVPTQPIGGTTADSN